MCMCMWSTRLANAKRRTLLDASRSWSYESIRRRSTDSRVPKPIGARPSLGTLLPSSAGECVNISTSPNVTAARRLVRLLGLSSSELPAPFSGRTVCGSTVRRSTASGLLGPSCTALGPAPPSLASYSSSSVASSSSLAGRPVAKGIITPSSVGASLLSTTPCGLDAARAPKAALIQSVALNAICYTSLTTCPRLPRFPLIRV